MQSQQQQQEVHNLDDFDSFAQAFEQAQTTTGNNTQPTSSSSIGKEMENLFDSSNTNSKMKQQQQQQQQQEGSDIGSALDDFLDITPSSKKESESSSSSDRTFQSIMDSFNTEKK